jgi:hypothetical protein
MAIEPGKELLWKYISGHCDPHEVEFVNSWLQSDPENEKTLERLRLYQTISKSNGEKNETQTDDTGQIEEESILSTYLPAIILIFLVFILLSLYFFIKNA